MMGMGTRRVGAWARGETEFYRMCSTGLWSLCCNYLYIKPGGMFGQIDQLLDLLNYILTIKTSIKHLLHSFIAIVICY